MLPKPWQVGQAPNGLLNENSRGCGSSYGDAARAALEALAEHGARAGGRASSRELDRERGAAALRDTPSRSSRSAARAGRRRPCTRSTITCSVGRSRSVGGIDVLERDGLAVDEQAAEALAPQRGERLGDRIDQPGQRRLRRGGIVGSPPSPLPSLLVVRRLGRRGHRPTPATTGMSKPISSRVPAGSVAEPPGDDLGRLADHFLAAVAAERPADAREEQAHVVVDLGRRADRRARIADAVLLADGDRRADALDASRRPASPSARGTGARRPTATRRSGAALRRRSCRRRATTCPTR